MQVPYATTSERDMMLAAGSRGVRAGVKRCGLPGRRPRRHHAPPEISGAAPRPHRTTPLFETRSTERAARRATCRHAGGAGDYIEDTPPMLGIWNTLLGEATIVF